MATVFKLYMDGQNIQAVMAAVNVSKGSVSGYLNEIEAAIGCRIVRGSSHTNKGDSLKVAGLNGNTDWYNTTLGDLHAGRPVRPDGARPGHRRLAGPQAAVPASAGTLPTGTPLFAVLMAGIAVIIVGLTYFPVLALGPIVEHLVGKF